jgi:hypothetical protein
MNAPIVYEPIRFGVSGLGYACGVMSGFITDACDYALDAPEFIAQGSTRCTHMNKTDLLNEKHYVSYTTPRRDW